MRNKKATGVERLKVRYGRMFVLPWTIGLILFFIVPLVESIAYAFSNVSLTSDDMLTFAGLEHFRYLIKDDLNFIDNLKDAVISFIYSLPIIVALSMIFALILSYFSCIIQRYCVQNKGGAYADRSAVFC